MIFVLLTFYSWSSLAYINPAVGGYWITFLVSALAIALFRIKSIFVRRPSGKLEFLNCGKARVLQKLSAVYDKDLFLPMEILGRGQWEVMSLKQKNNWLKTLTIQGPWIVRSSFSSEDLASASSAGAFLSLRCEELTIGVVEKVFGSNPHPSASDEVFIQPFLVGMKKVGVLATRYPSAPGQAVMEFTEVAESGNEVTSGVGTTQVFYRFRNTDFPLSFGDSCLERVFQLGISMEKHFCQRPLDIEFAVDSRGRLKILQVRPIPLPAQAESRIPQVNKMVKEVEDLSGASADLPEIWSRMTDWNPAEILGNHPSPLAISLYEELLCRSEWSKQRGRLGYSRPEPSSLLRTFFGQPYVDVKKSLYSFLPKGLGPELKSRILDFQLDLMKSHPDLHDRVEFDISLSSSPLFPEMNEVLSQKNPDLSDLEKKLWLNELDVIHDKLVSEAEQLFRESQHLRPFPDEVDGCWREIKETSKQFVIASRCGFVAISRLRELEKKFSLPNFVSEFAGTAAGKAIEDWYQQYHQIHGFYPFLRSFSLEWRSPGQSWGKESVDSQRKFCAMDINSLCREYAAKINPVPEEVLDFCFKGVYLREHIKRSLYQQIHHFFTLVDEKVPEKLSKDIELFNVQELFRWLNDGVAPESPRLMRRRRDWQVQRLICMPDCFSDLRDLFLFETSGDRGTYLGAGEIQATPTFLTGDEVSMDLSGKVVLIERAEPGLDWIFSQNPKALITRFGGPNSHVAIRCFEKSIPALIGVGENCFFHLKNAESIYLDFGNQRLETKSRGQ